MTLRMRMTLSTAGLILSLLMLTGLSLWAVVGVSRRHAKTYEEYAELRLIERVGIEFAKTRGMIEAADADPDVIRDSIFKSLELLEHYLTLREQHQRGSAEHQPYELDSVRDMVASLRDMVEQLGGRRPILRASERASLVQSADRLLESLEKLVAQAGETVMDSRDRAIDVTRQAVVSLSAIGAVVAIAGVLLCIVQYLSVIRPLRRLRQSARQIASGRLNERVDERADREFAELARDFNVMAGELEALYRDLEQRVATKSRQLVRSERLASVGYLAAGVAHEINNPLSIIAGHAELTLNRLRKLPRETFDPDVAESLQIVQEEAFRCKAITSKLLSLTRQDESLPHEVDLMAVARDVHAMVAGLKQFRDRTVELEFDGNASLPVLAREPEMKQVLLNLTINSLEATAPGSGRVRIEGHRHNGRVLLSVLDNGRGMPPEVLEHVFEPFFTQKRGSPASGAEPGTGLGLSIVHAIIEACGGQIEAHSDGPGTGSRFTIDLPACNGDVSHGQSTAQP